MPFLVPLQNGFDSERAPSTAVGGLFPQTLTAGGVSRVVAGAAVVSERQVQNFDQALQVESMESLMTGAASSMFRSPPIPGGPAAVAMGSS